MSEQDEREVLLDLLTHLPAGVTEEGEEIPLLYILPESAREYLCDAILTEGFHLAPTTGLKAEALREAAESALREAADDLRIESENAEPEKPSAYREGVAAGLLQAEDIVRTRADSIRAEREEEDE